MSRVSEPWAPETTHSIAPSEVDCFVIPAKFIGALNPPVRRRAPAGLAPRWGRRARTKLAVSQLGRGYCSREWTRERSIGRNERTTIVESGRGNAFGRLRTPSNPLERPSTIGSTVFFFEKIPVDAGIHKHGFTNLWICVAFFKNWNLYFNSSTYNDESRS